MKKLLSTLVLIFAICSFVSAQQNHFIYIQSANKQAFYVKVDNKVYTATNGFLIISKMQDGNHQMTIGYTNSTEMERTFDCVVAGKDLGFSLNEMTGQAGAELLNLQTLAKLKAVRTSDVAKADTKNSTVVAGQTDAFGEMLSNATGDASLKVVPVMN
jgi:hypothetical protein